MRRGTRRMRDAVWAHARWMCCASLRMLRACAVPAKRAGWRACSQQSAGEQHRGASGVQVIAQRGHEARTALAIRAGPHAVCMRPDGLCTHRRGTVHAGGKPAACRVLVFAGVPTQPAGAGRAKSLQTASACMQRKAQQGSHARQVNRRLRAGRETGAGDARGKAPWKNRANQEVPTAARRYTPGRRPEKRVRPTGTKDTATGPAERTPGSETERSEAVPGSMRG